MDIGNAINLAVDDAGVAVSATVRTTDRTGVEMEALTGASVAALAVYDMCKGVSHDILLGATWLREKKGGKSGHYDRGVHRPRAGKSGPFVGGVHRL